MRCVSRERPRDVSTYLTQKPPTAHSPCCSQNTSKGGTDAKKIKNIFEIDIIIATAIVYQAYCYYYQESTIAALWLVGGRTALLDCPGLECRIELPPHVKCRL